MPPKSSPRKRARSAASPKVTTSDDTQKKKVPECKHGVKVPSEIKGSKRNTEDSKLVKPGLNSDRQKKSAPTPPESIALPPPASPFILLGSYHSVVAGYEIHISDALDTSGSNRFTKTVLSQKFTHKAHTGSVAAVAVSPFPYSANNAGQHTMPGETKYKYTMVSGGGADECVHFYDATFSASSVENKSKWNGCVFKSVGTLHCATQVNCFSFAGGNGFPSNKQSDAKASTTCLICGCNDGSLYIYEKDGGGGAGKNKLFAWSTVPAAVLPLFKGPVLDLKAFNSFNTSNKGVVSMSTESGEEEEATMTNGMITVALSANREFACLDLTTGDIVWKYKMPPTDGMPMSLCFPSYTPSASTHEVPFCAVCCSGAVTVFSLLSGKPMWRVAIPTIGKANPNRRAFHDPRYEMTTLVWISHPGALSGSFIVTNDDGDVIRLIRPSGNSNEERVQSITPQQDTIPEGAAVTIGNIHSLMSEHVKNKGKQYVRSRVRAMCVLQQSDKDGDSVLGAVHTDGWICCLNLQLSPSKVSHSLYSSDPLLSLQVGGSYYTGGRVTSMDALVTPVLFGK